jgi:hypothetical protein
VRLLIGYSRCRHMGAVSVCTETLTRSPPSLPREPGAAVFFNKPSS